MSKKKLDRERAYSLGFADGAVWTALDEIKNQKSAIAGYFVVAFFFGPFMWGSLAYAMKPGIDSLIAPAVLGVLMIAGHVADRNRLDQRSVKISDRKELPASISRRRLFSPPEMDW